MTELTTDMVGLFMKRAYDIAGTTPGVKVFLNGTKIGFNSKTPFRDYCKLYIENKVMENGNPFQLVYEKCNNPQAKPEFSKILNSCDFFSRFPRYFCNTS